MKNNISKIAVLLLSLALVTSCKPVNRQPGGNTVSDSSKTGVDNIDEIVRGFLKDTSVAMPSFESYKKDLTCDVCYYYASKIYLLNIKSEDNGVMIEYLNTQLPGNSNLLTLNDDTTYTVEDSGYIL